MSNNLLKEDFKTQFKKFTEKEGIDKDTVQYYFKFFKKIKDKFPKAFEIEGLRTSIPVEKRKDIDAYQTFKELENVVDYLRGQVDLGEDEKVQITNDTTVYEDDNLKISKGMSLNNCISIKQAGSRGKKISWCVATEGSGQYYAKRFGENESTFYFILNKNKPINDKFFFFVIQVIKDGSYIVTSSENDGDISMPWEEIIAIEPLITNLKSIFKHEKIKPEEREAAGLDKITDRTYPTLTYTQKKKYIEGLRKLSNSMFEVTPIELIEYYINLDTHLLSSAQVSFLEKKNSKLLKRYNALLERKIKNNKFLLELKKLNSDFRKYKNEINLDLFKGERGFITNIDFGFSGTIYLNVNDMDDVYKEADISVDGLNYLESVSSRYYEEDWDSYQVNYMWNYFDPETENLMIKLLKYVGIKNSELDRLIDEGELSKILEKFGFKDKIEEAFLTEHSNMVERAKNEAASADLEKYNSLPIEFDRGRDPSINIEDINNFISAVISIDPTISNFEDAVIALLESTDLSGAELYELEYYNYEDPTELNIEMRRIIESVIEDIEDEGYGEYFEKINTILDTLKFKNDIFENELVKVIILEKTPEEFDEITPQMIEDPTIKIEFINKKSNKKEIGNIKLSSLPNYVQNYQLFEELTRIKKMMIIM